jgi:hypothetical protein
LAGIPEELERQLDERRSHPEWFISHKRVAASLGFPTAAIAFETEAGAFVQGHEAGTIMYHDGNGSAFEMHGAIYEFYAASDRTAELGYLTSDEGNASVQSGGRKNTFSNSAIYWSPAIGAVPVTDRIYLSYEDISGVDVIGFPVSAATSLAGGVEQEFQHGRIYHRMGTPIAHEVHGAILAKYLEIGGAQSWGFPVSDEGDVTKDGRVIGKVSEFESCTIYWSDRTGAFEVHGDIRGYYDRLAGPAGALGFPTSDELDIPGHGRFNTFENGSLCWYGSPDSIVHAPPFTIFLDRIETVESEAPGRGQNDIYLKEVKVTEGGRTIYKQRHPRSGTYAERNIVEPKISIQHVIVPNVPNKEVTLSIDIWDSDQFDPNDDHLGRYVKVLGPVNAWGFRENQGVFNSGSFSKIRAILWSVKPQLAAFRLHESQKFWGHENDPTPEISYQKYAATFRDVDSEPEWWDVSDWLERLFYEVFVDSVASSGNCFGMSLEAIYARKNLSRFGLPLDRFRERAQLEPEFNVKQCYQLGALSIWWVVEQFLRGNTHDPKDVFLRSREAFFSGRHPLLCMTQNYNFSGAPHCVLPVRWDESSKPWRIGLFDPNSPSHPDLPDRNLRWLYH